MSPEVDSQPEWFVWGGKTYSTALERSRRCSWERGGLESRWEEELGLGVHFPSCFTTINVQFLSICGKLCWRQKRIKSRANEDPWYKLLIQ